MAEVSGRSVEDFLKNYGFGMFSSEAKIMEAERSEISAGLREPQNSRIKWNERNSEIYGAIHFKKLKWDTEFFGFPCAQISFLHSHTGRYDRDLKTNMALLDDFNEWCKTEKIKFAVSKIDERDLAAISALECQDFRFVETVQNMTYKYAQNFEFIKNSCIRRPFKEADMKKLEDIAASSRYDRFHSDPGFAQHVDRFRRTWIYNLCHGLADAVFVAECDKEIAGFIACDSRESGQRLGFVRLIAKDPNYTNRGVGKALVNQAKNWFWNKADIIYTSTQSKNAASLGMYTAAGFRFAATQATLHRWW